MATPWAESAVYDSFVTNSQTLLALGQVNREHYSSFSFAVYAVDHGTPSLTGSALVVVVVADVNDELPVFSRDAYELVVDENLPAGTDVGSVFAVDGDAAAASNGAVRYSLVDPGRGGDAPPPPPPFSVDAETGNVRTTARLDRERRELYRLRVAAADRGEPALTATVDVVVRVADENDNSPVLEFTSTAAAAAAAGSTGGLLDVDTIVISSGVPRGAVVCRAVARDPDLGANSRINFRLVSRPEVRTPFVVDRDSGEISVAAEFPGVRGGEAREYLLTVRATDAGLPPRSVDAVLRVVVNGSLPYLPSAEGGGAPLATGSLVTGNHVTLVVVIAGSCALVTVALVVAIAVVRTRGRKSRLRCHQYDVQRSLTADDLTKSTVTSFETVPLSSTFCSGDLALHASSLPAPQSTSRTKLVNGTVHADDDSFRTLPFKVPFSGVYCNELTAYHDATVAISDGSTAYQ